MLCMPRKPRRDVAYYRFGASTKNESNFEAVFHTQPSLCHRHIQNVTSSSIPRAIRVRVLTTHAHSTVGQTAGSRVCNPKRPTIFDYTKNILQGPHSALTTSCIDSSTIRIRNCCFDSIFRSVQL